MVAVMQGVFFVHLQRWLKLMGVLTSFIYDEQKGQLSALLCLLMEKKQTGTKARSKCAEWTRVLLRVNGELCLGWVLLYTSMFLRSKNTAKRERGSA